MKIDTITLRLSNWERYFPAAELNHIYIFEVLRLFYENEKGESDYSEFCSVPMDDFLTSIKLTGIDSCDLEPYLYDLEIHFDLIDIIKSNEYLKYRLLPQSAKLYGVRQYTNMCDSIQTKRTDRAGFVYFLQNSNAVKIGKTIDLSSRLKLIRLELPVKSKLLHTIKSNDYSECEKFFHDKFADKRMNGEWFKLTAKDIEYCQKIETLDF